jgi:hypothetical protein
MESDESYRAKLAKLTLDDLLDIGNHIDRERFPTRIAMVLERIADLRELKQKSEAFDANRARVPYVFSNATQECIAVNPFLVFRKTSWLTSETVVHKAKEPWLSVKPNGSIHLDQRKVGNIYWKSIGVISDNLIGALDFGQDHFALHKEWIGEGFLYQQPKYCVYHNQMKIGSFQMWDEVKKPDNFYFEDQASLSWVVALFQFDLWTQWNRFSD